MGVDLNIVLIFLLEHINDYYVNVNLKYHMQNYVVLSKCELWWLQLVLLGTCLRFCLHLDHLALMEKSSISSYTEIIIIIIIIILQATFIWHLACTCLPGTYVSALHILTYVHNSPVV